MKVLDLLMMLRDRGIQVWPEDDRLRCNAPAGALTPQLREELRQRKDEILNFLRSSESIARQQRAVVPLQPNGTSPSVFAVAGHNGDVFCFRALLRYLGANQPFYGLQPPGLDGQGEPLTRVEDMAGYFASQIPQFQPNGPYVIAGFCAGGAIAFELAQQLLQAGAAVTDLVLFGAAYPTAFRPLAQLRKNLKLHVERVVQHAHALRSLSLSERWTYFRQRWGNYWGQRSAASSALTPLLVRRAAVERATLAAIPHYTPRHFAGRLHLLLPCQEWLSTGNQALRWGSMAQHVEKHFGPAGCNADNMLREPYARTFAELFNRSLAPRTIQANPSLLVESLGS